MQALWGQCATVVKQVKVNKYSWPFHKPVDWKTLNLPDYPTIVKIPMDLQTVTDKLGGVDAKGDRTYQTPLQMRDDMRVIFDNCRLYNQPGQDVRIMGDMLSDHFEKRWQNSNIEGKWLMECEIQKYEDEELAQIEAGKWGRPVGGDAAVGTMPAATAAPVPVPVAQPVVAPPAPVPKPAPAAPAAAAPVVAVAGSSGRGAMPFEQKRKLSVALGMLPPEKLVQVVEIVKRRATISGGDDGNDEIELDMETLDSETLWELDDYVNQCKKKKGGKPTQDEKIHKAEQARLEAERQLKEVQASLSAPRTDPLLERSEEGRSDKGDGPVSKDVPAAKAESDSDSEDEEADLKSNAPTFA
jgi:hypothetical protein